MIPSDVRSLLDQLKDLAESLGLPKEEGAEEAATQPGEEKLQKKLPPQLNPLLAKLARAAARENDKSPGKQFCDPQSSFWHKPYVHSIGYIWVLRRLLLTKNMARLTIRGVHMQLQCTSQVYLLPW